jgi:hypothetical protein
MDLSGYTRAGIAALAPNRAKKSPKAKSVLTT